MSDSAPVSAPVTPDAAPVGAKPQAPSAKPQAPAAPEKTYRVKVDGQEREVPESELIRGYTHGTAAHQKMQEAAKLRQQGERIEHLLKNDPEQLFKEMRANPAWKKAAENYIWEQIQEEQLTPEAKKQKELEERLRRYEEMEKKHKDEADQAEWTAVQQRYAQEYVGSIQSALQEGGLPKTSGTVRRMTELMSTAIKAGYEPHPKDLVSMVHESYVKEIRELFSAADGPTILKLLGDDTAKKLRKEDLARLKGSGLQTTPRTGNAPRRQVASGQKQTMSREAIMARIQGR